MIKIKPLGKQILVKVEVETATPGGIVIPEQYRKVPRRGRVEATGSRMEIDVEIGDTILFPNYLGSVVPGEDCLFLLEEDDVLAKIVP